MCIVSKKIMDNLLLTEKQKEKCPNIILNEQYVLKIINRYVTNRIKNK